MKNEVSINELNQKLLEKIKEVRKAKKINQAQMAELLNIAQASYSTIELGKAETSSKKLLAILHFLGLEHFDFQALQSHSEKSEKDVEERLSQVEAKLDLILKKLDEL